MLTTKILSVLTLIFIPMANVSTVIASQDNKDDNTNMSDTLNLSGSLSKSNSFASDANSNSSFDDNAENETNATLLLQTHNKNLLFVMSRILNLKMKKPLYLKTIHLEK